MLRSALINRRLNQRESAAKYDYSEGKSATAFARKIRWRCRVLYTPILRDPFRGRKRVYKIFRLSFSLRSQYALREISRLFGLYSNRYGTIRDFIIAGTSNTDAHMRTSCCKRQKPFFTFCLFPLYFGS